MSKEEKTGERPTDYSIWHRKELPSYCMAQDIDWIEYRIDKEGKIEIVALIETGRWNRVRFTDTQREVIETIANALNIPAYFVEYTIDENNYKNNLFKVTKLKTDKLIILSNKEYKDFLKNLIKRETLISTGTSKKDGKENDEA